MYQVDLADGTSYKLAQVAPDFICPFSLQNLASLNYREVEDRIITCNEARFIEGIPTPDESLSAFKKWLKSREDAVLGISSKIAVQHMAIAYIPFMNYVGTSNVHFTCSKTHGSGSGKHTVTRRGVHDIDFNLSLACGFASELSQGLDRDQVYDVSMKHTRLYDIEGNLEASAMIFEATDDSKNIYHSYAQEAIEKFAQHKVRDTEHRGGYGSFKFTQATKIKDEATIFMPCHIINYQYQGQNYRAASLTSEKTAFAYDYPRSTALQVVHKLFRICMWALPLIVFLGSLLYQYKMTTEFEIMKSIIVGGFFAIPTAIAVVLLHFIFKFILRLMR